MSQFAVLTAGEDCWTVTDSEGVPQPVRFDTYKQAQDAINDHMADLESEGIDFDADEYTVVEEAA